MSDAHLPPGGGYPPPGTPGPAPWTPGPGAPPPAKPALEPIGVLLNRTFELYKAHFTAFVITAAVVLAPIFLVRDGLTTLFLGTGNVATARLEQRGERLQELSERMQAMDPNDLQNVEDLQKMQEEIVRESVGAVAESAGILGGMFASLFVLLLSIPLTVLATFLAQGALTVIVNDRAAGGSLSPGGAWGQLMPRLPGLLITSLLVTVGVLVGTLLCVLPGMVFSFACAFVMPIVVNEGLSGVGAIERSIRLVQVDLVRVAVALILMLVIQFVVGTIGGMLPLGPFGSSVVADILSIAVLPLPITALVLMHRELLAKGAVPPVATR